MHSYFVSCLKGRVCPSFLFPFCKGRLRRVLAFVLAFVLSLPLLFPLASTGHAAALVRIGVMAPLTGKMAGEGEDARRLLELLAAHWNAVASQNAFTLELHFQDDAGDPRTAALAAQKLLASGVVAIISTYGSSVTEATQALIDEAGLPHFSSGATSVRLTEKNLPAFFRMGPRDDAQSRKALDCIVRQGYRRIAIVHDNTSHPKGFAEEVRKLILAPAPSATSLPEIVFFDALPPGQRDYSASLQKIRQSTPDLLLYTGYYPETALLLRQKAEMNWNIPMLGGDASNHQDLVSMAGKDLAEGYMFLSAPMPQYLNNPQALRFLDLYVQKYQHYPLSVWSALSGDALNLIASALKQNGVQKPAIAEFAHALRAGEPYAGLSGPVAFDAKGDRIGDLYLLYTVNKGIFVPKNIFETQN